MPTYQTTLQALSEKQKAAKKQKPRTTFLEEHFIVLCGEKFLVETVGAEVFLAWLIITHPSIAIDITLQDLKPEGTTNRSVIRALAREAAEAYDRQVYGQSELSLH